MSLFNILVIILSAVGTCSAYSSLIQRSGEYLLINDLESGWSEYSDRSQHFWQYDGNRVNVNLASAKEIAILPGMNGYAAEAIITDREKNGKFKDLAELKTRTGLPSTLIEHLDRLIKFSDPIDFQGRVHVRANRRYGSKNDHDVERYDGSPIAITQRYMLSNRSLKIGATFDKDRYEPEITDLSRFYLLYSRDKFQFIAGDFHINHGAGLVLWTRPSYFDGFHSSSAYKLRKQGIQPARETTQNSGLRGVAIQHEWDGGGLFDVFMSQTQYDATIFGEGLNRLSSSGLHRTEGETVKKNSVTENATGFLLTSPVWDKDWKVKISSSGYLAKFDKEFEYPIINERDLFLLRGDIVGATGINFNISHLSGLHTINCNAEFSRDKYGNIAWSAMSEFSKFRSFSCYGAVYDFPENFQNPHAKPPPGSSKPQNCNGGALLLKLRPDILKINRMSAHIEMKQTPFRTYTIPHPTTSLKGSMMCSWSTSNGSDVIVLYRQKIGEEGNGERLPTDDINEQKFRLTVSSIPLLDKNCKIWVETASRVVNDDPAVYGIVTGVRSMGNIWKSVRYSLGVSYFSSKKGHYLYQGEYGLPDRLAAIKLSGSGMRINGLILVRSSRTDWLGFQVARTVKYSGQSGDMELYVTCSYNLDQSLLKWE